MKTKEATLVAYGKQYAMVPAKQDEEYQEFHEAIEHMNDRQESVGPRWNESRS